MPFRLYDALMRKKPAAIKTDENSDTRDTVSFGLIAACFAISGFAALIYQTVWARQFSIELGTSHLAVAAILAAYMAGLASGAGIASLYVHRVKKPLLLYAIIEGGIAVTALLMPVMMKLLRSSFISLFGGASDLVSSQPEHFVFYVGAVFVAVVIPTGLMGATLPLLTRYVVVRDTHIGSRISQLYALNTAGAVIGALVSGFILIPQLGLFGSIIVAAAANLSILLVAAWLARSSQGLIPAKPVEILTDSRLHGIERVQPFYLRRSTGMLFLIAASGTIAFAYEVLWTRLLSQVFGGTVYAFATMLGTFLAGIALGGFLVNWLTTTRQASITWFAIVQVSMAVCSAGTFALLSALMPNDFDTLGMVTYSAAVMLPATIFLGATFPLAVHFIVSNADVAATGTARVYAWNTIGAIFGALGAAFFALPVLGFEGLLKLTVLCNFLLSLGAILLSAPSIWRFAMGAAMACSVLIVFFLYNPNRPDSVLYASTAQSQNPGREIFYAVGRSSTALVRDSGGTFEMSTDGLPEASVMRAGQVPVIHSQQWMTMLPLLARPEAKDLLVIGLGGGIALEAIPPFVKNISVIEIEPEIVEANQRIATRRAIDPLSDSRVKVVLNDARSALALTSRTFDVIASQPSHPWTAGASHLYTKEFLNLAHQRLNAGGVFVQWINAEYVDERLLRILMSTLATEFKYLRLYHPTPGVLFFLGSDSPLEIERRALSGQLSFAPFAKVGLATAEDILASLALEDGALRNLSASSQPNTDDRNQLAAYSKSRGDGLKLSDLRRMFAPFDPLLQPNGWVHGEVGEAIDFPYLAGQLLQRRFQERAFDLARSLPDGAQRSLVDGIGYSTYGQIAEAGQAFVQALRQDNANSQAIFLLIRPHLPALARGTAASAILQLAESLTGTARDVIDGWKYGERRDWDALKGLDTSLSTVRVTDAWYPQATKLRAEWRVAIAQIEKSSEDAHEAILILNEVLARAPSFDLAILRAGAGLLAGESGVFIESTSTALEVIRLRMQQAAEGRYQFTAEERLMTTNRLAGVMGQLEILARGENGLRATEVLEKAKVVIARLNRASDGNP